MKVKKSCRWHQQTIKAIILSLKPIYPRFFSSFQNNLFPFRANSNAGNIVYDKSKIMIAFYIDADGLGLKLVSYWIWLLQHLLCFIQNDWIGNIAKIISWFYYYQYHSITLLLIMKIMFWVLIYKVQFAFVSELLGVFLNRDDYYNNYDNYVFKPMLLITLILLLNPIQGCYLRIIEKVIH